MIDINKYPAIKKAIEMGPEWDFHQLKEHDGCLVEEGLVEAGALDGELSSLPMSERCWAITQIETAMGVSDVACNFFKDYRRGVAARILAGKPETGSWYS